jgi:hypothetical protein
MRKIIGLVFVIVTVSLIIGVMVHTSLNGLLRTFLLKGTGKKVGEFQKR